MTNPTQPRASAVDAGVHAAPPASAAAAAGSSTAAATTPASQPVADARRLQARVAVLGASGYSGQEFARLALAHQGIDLAVLVSREHAGRPASEVLTGLDPRVAAMPVVAHPDALASLLEAGAFDTLVCCLPHGAWKAMAKDAPALANVPARIIDLSSDHRDGADGYVYGLPEAFRVDIANAARVANPGCYPTAASLALLPAAELGWLGETAMITAVSGASGAGRSVSLRTSFVELDGGAAFYKVGVDHVHVAEMERNLVRVGGPIALGFAPQLAPMARGILLTATATLPCAISEEQVREAYALRYANEAFVRVLPPGDFPQTRLVRASNRCDLSVQVLHGGRTLVVTTAIDNLVKGAAGQALQNLNLMLGWPETWGLPVNASPW